MSTDCLSAVMVSCEPTASEGPGGGTRSDLRAERDCGSRVAGLYENPFSVALLSTGSECARIAYLRTLPRVGAQRASGDRADSRAKPSAWVGVPGIPQPTVAAREARWHRHHPGRHVHHAQRGLRAAQPRLSILHDGLLVRSTVPAAGGRAGDDLAAVLQRSRRLSGLAHEAHSLGA